MSVLQLHMSIGISIGALALLRIIWRLGNPLPLPVPGPKWQHTAASAMHIALYLFMIGMAITGYLGTSINNQYFQVLEIPKFSDTGLYKWLIEGKLGMRFEEFEVPVDFVHKQLGGQFLIWILIGAHTAAALFHHFTKRDATLRRMLPDWFSK